jgi:probable phosphoglycerate mutase
VSTTSTDADLTTRLVLIRHGESNATVERRIRGHRTCSGLSPLGHEQADALAERLRRTGELPADVLFASNFQRALQTAEHLAPVWDLPVDVDPGLGEHDPGDVVDGMTFDEFVAAHPEWRWGADPYVSGFPGGETIAAFHLRVGTAVSRIVGEHPGRTIVIVCHGGVVDAVLRQMMRAPMTGSFELFTANTSLTEFVTSARQGWRLVRYNDAAHLAGLPQATVPDEVLSET